MFNKDLLLFDLEATGLDVTKHEIIQLSAILLDKKTLKEKKRFDSYIKPSNWNNWDPESMEVNGIATAQLKKAPGLKTVLAQFIKTFGTNVLPATYGGNLDIVYFPAAFRQAKMKYPYDYHTFNFWPLCYTYMAKRKKLTNKKRFVGFRLEEIAADLGVPTPEHRHNALVDCEYEAAVLRTLLKKISV